MATKQRAKANTHKKNNVRSFLFEVTADFEQLEKFYKEMLPAAAVKKLTPKLNSLRESFMFAPRYMHVDLSQHIPVDVKQKKMFKKMFAQFYKEFTAQQKASAGKKKKTSAPDFSDFVDDKKDLIL